VVILISIVFPGFFFAIGAFFSKSSLSVKQTIISGYDIFVSYFIGQTKISLENEKLRKIATEINGFKKQNDFLKEENLKLRSIPVNGESHVALVIATPPQAPYSMMIISNSEKSSVGDSVTSVSGIYLGEIAQKNENLAKVTLASKGGNVFFTENQRTGERFEITGKGVNNFIVSVPKDTDIKKDDPLIVRKSSGSYVVAIIKEIETRESSPFLFVYALSPVSVYSTSSVLVHKENNEEFTQ